MAKITKKDLIYNDYSWTTVLGDNPTKKKEDADRFSRKEGYEVINLLNFFEGQTKRGLSVHIRNTIEWMINEKLPSGIQKRSEVISWIEDNYKRLSSQSPYKLTQA